MSRRKSLAFRLALGVVPRAWREMVRDDLAEQGRPGPLGATWRVLHVLGIACSLHGVFTTTAVAADVREAVRSVTRARGFAVGAILTFALGIGVNLAVFAAVDRMLFRALPYDQPDQLVVMGAYPATGPGPFGVIPPAYTAGALHLPAILAAGISTWNPDRYRFTENPEGAAYNNFVVISYTLLGAVRVHPILGRDFTREDARSGRHSVLLSYVAWQHDFGGRADVVGRRIWAEAASADAQIAGVLPADFFPPQVDRFTLDWSGLSVNGTTLESDSRFVSTPPVLRLAPGVSLEAAQAQVTAMDLAIRGREARPHYPPTTTIRLVPLREVLFGRYEPYLLLVFAAATLVLLVGCTNLTSLMLVRARSRERRVALQRALGASTAQVLRAAIIEALLLAFAGAVVAVVVLTLADQAISVWLPPVFSGYAASVSDRRVLLFALALATAGAIVAGVWPGWHTAHVDVMSTLQRGSGRRTSGAIRGSSAILVIEIAVSLVLVASATLAARNLIALLRTDLGFQAEQLWGVDATLPPTSDQSMRLRQYTDALAILRSLPIVRSAAGADVLPIIGALNAKIWAGEDRGQRWAVTDDFVETMGMRLVAGRTMSPAEVAARVPVGVLSEGAVTLAWPGVTPQEAVGRYLRSPGEAPREVVGVAADVRGRYGEPTTPALYVPIGREKFRSLEFAVRLNRGATLSVGEVTRRLTTQGLAPSDVEVFPIATRLSISVQDDRFRAELLSGFGLVALVLAMVGVYAVQAFNVSLRATEFGIRLSLGATPHHLWRMLIRQALAPVVVGVGLGLLATFWAAQFLQSFLAKTDARDPTIYTGVALSLVVVVTIATLGPVRRATRTDPTVVLRAE